MTEQNVSQAYRILLKSMMADLGVAGDFLKAHLSVDIVEQCDFSTLKLEPALHTEDLGEHCTDMLYSVMVNHHKTLLYLLVDQQPQPDRFASFRIWQRIPVMLTQFHANHPEDELPVIIPLFVYAGEQSPYPFSMDVADCFTDKASARESINSTTHFIPLNAALLN